jgi:(1->4)-alpha-D-glucan 1-alpha-D-glucosylmutase
LNPEIGSTDDYRHFVETLSQHGMSHILDTVPNHMGVETNENQWWNDVLTHGTKSQYANYFDIDWDVCPPRKELADKVLMPVLGETFAEALKMGALRLEGEEGKPYIDYHGRRLPLDPTSNTDQELPKLLEDQHYRLCYWRVAADEINYRRFFDITGLAALQMQRPEVFDAAHEFTFKLIADGSVDGLRVDHPDGLLDPREYFDRLQAKYAAVCPEQKQLFVSVEKILNGDETLCEDWPVSGTSGYDFLCAVNDLFVNPENESAVTEVYENFVGDRTAYRDWIYLAKCVVLDTAMYSELTSLTNRLDALAQADLSSRDFTRRQLQHALREVIACFPVYRSYVSIRGVSESDIAVVDQAVSEARRRNATIDPTAFQFIRDSILLCYPVAESVRSKQLDFTQRFQQLTSPVNAKGIEDCTFYNYNRLTSLNEVGGDPGRFGRSGEAIHRYFSHRQSRWPLALSSLSTHDTKRSEDVRARLNVLAEISAEWTQHLNHWREANADLCGTVHPNDQILLYQTLLGAWPLQPMDDADRNDFGKRISTYMIKATREAKQRNSWLNPDKEYEAAMTCLIETLIDPQAGKRFLADFLPFQKKKISRLGMFNSLSQTTIRLTAPGICDTYQGTELWDFSLVDPDNRRAVDYERRKQMLADINPAKLTETMDDGSIKLWLTTQLLRYRRDNAALFLKGSYEPINPIGERARNLFCFTRILESQFILIVVPRFLASAAPWGDTRIALPSAIALTCLQNLLTGEKIDIGANQEIQVSHLLENFPVAILIRPKN